MACGKELVSDDGHIKITGCPFRGHRDTIFQLVHQGMKVRHGMPGHAAGPHSAGLCFQFPSIGESVDGMS